MTSYANASEQLPDFEISYRFRSFAEGGRQDWTPYQHYRCDWSYEGDNIAKTGIYMIWPEFLAADGSIFPNDIPVPAEGFATMWIVSPQMRCQIHCQRIKVGVKGYFMEGGRQVAEAIVRASLIPKFVILNRYCCSIGLVDRISKCYRSRSSDSISSFSTQTHRRRISNAIS